jgi:excisionase family DNA binding protein
MDTLAVASLLTISETSKRLSCSPGFVRRLIDRGKLHAIRDGRFVRLFPDSVVAYLSQHSTNHNPTPAAKRLHPGLHFD